MTGLRAPHEGLDGRSPRSTSAEARSNPSFTHLDHETVRGGMREDERGCYPLRGGGNSFRSEIFGLQAATRRR
jgi:hypothetical protein